MIKNVVFDYGGVLIDWNPHYLYDGHFKDAARYEYFLNNVCNMAWCNEIDRGKPFDDGIADKCVEFPDYEVEIKMFRDQWITMIGGQLPGAQEFVQRLKDAGYHVWGLTNWCCETFYQVKYVYPIFKLMEGMIVSGEEHLLKPEPEMYQRLFDRFNLKPEECVFVDDRKVNTDGAERVGMKGIWFKGFDNLKEELNKLGVNI